MAKGVSIHIGLNEVDESAYGGWNGLLRACEADARDMEAVAIQKGFTSTKILTAAATADTVKDAIRSAAGTLVKGDLFFLTYSGHGGQIPDESQDEDDGYDETWVFYDRQIIDNELYFAAGVSPQRKVR